MGSEFQIEIPSEQVSEFCRRNRIRKLSLFGSVLRNDFRPDSDIDVLVEFEPEAEHSLFDLLRMQDELQDLFGREVDLVEASGLRNPFRRQEIMRTQRPIFAAIPELGVCSYTLTMTTPFGSRS